MGFVKKRIEKSINNWNLEFFIFYRMKKSTIKASYHNNQPEIGCNDMDFSDFLIWLATRRRPTPIYAHSVFAEAEAKHKKNQKILKVANPTKQKKMKEEIKLKNF